MRQKSSKNIAEFILFWSFIYFWAWDQSVFNIPSETIGEKYFFYCEQLSTGDNLWVRNGTCALISQHWGLIWLAGSACYQSLSSYVQVVSRRLCFLGVVYPHWLLKSFYLLSSKIPWASEERFNGDITFRTECFKASHSLFIVLLFPSTAGGTFSHDCRTSHWPMSRTALLLHSFRTVAFAFGFHWVHGLFSLGFLATRTVLDIGTISWNGP